MGNKTLDTLVSDIYSLFETGADVEPEVAERLGKAIATTLITRLSQAKEERKPTLRMSNIGKHPSSLWHELHGYTPEPMQPHTYLKFLIGDVWEEVVLALAEIAGHEVTGQQDTIEIEGIVGHRDAVIDGVTVDVKSAAPFSFQKFKQGDLGSDSFGYIAQLSAYVQGDSTTSETGAFIACDKVSGALTVMELPDMLQVNAVEHIKNIKKIVESDTPPPVDGNIEPMGKSGNMKLGYPDSYCAYKVHRFPGLRKFIYSNGPVYLTEVVSKPSVPEVDLITGELIEDVEEANG